MTTLAEPEWDEATRNLALAYGDLDMCGVCNGPAYLCQDPERQDDWEATAPVRCHRQTAVRELQSRFTEESNPHMSALLWGSRLRRSTSG